MIEGWTYQMNKNIFDISYGSTVLIMFHDEENGITANSGRTVDISWLRSMDNKIFATSGQYVAEDIIAWKEI